jgi:hypothetical protein
MLVVCVLLAFPKIVAGVLYMLPVGIFGISLIFINWHIKGIFLKGLRWFGIFLGLGLSFTGVSLAGYAIFVSTIILQIPLPRKKLLQKFPVIHRTILSTNYFLLVPSWEFSRCLSGLL